MLLLIEFNAVPLKKKKNRTAQTQQRLTASRFATFFFLHIFCLFLHIFRF